MLSKKEIETSKRLKRPFLDPIRFEGDTIVEGITEALPFFRGVLLDLGCGSMPYGPLLKERITSHVGIDLRPNPDCPPTVCSDSLHLPFKAGSFDCILCTQVLEHVRNPLMMMSEASRVLRKEGHIILTMPLVWPLHEEPFDFFRYTKYGLTELARVNGLSVIRIQERGGGIMAISQLVGTILYDIFGKHWLSRWPMKLLFAPLLSLSKLVDRVFYYPKLTLGYVMVAQKR